MLNPHSGPDQLCVSDAKQQDPLSAARGVTGEETSVKWGILSIQRFPMVRLTFSSMESARKERSVHGARTSLGQSFVRPLAARRDECCGVGGDDGTRVPMFLECCKYLVGGEDQQV